MMRSAAFVLVALVGFLLTSTAVRTLVPWSDAYDLRAKLEAFAEVKDEIDAVHVGSSYTFRSVQPAIVDRTLGTEARPLRSFNLGVDGGTGYEIDAVLEHVLATRPARLRHVLIEPFDGSPHFLSPRNVETPRSVRWHTPGRTASAMGAALGLGGETTLNLELAWTHLRLGCWWLANYGAGPSIAGEWLGDQPAARLAAREQLASERGYQALDGREEPEFLERRARLLADPAAFGAEVAALSNRREHKPLDGFPVEVLRSQRARIEAAGARVIHVVPPRISPLPSLPALIDAGLLPVLLRYDDPTDPEVAPLYELRLRYDRGHLSRAGARLFSELYARDLAVEWARADAQDVPAPDAADR